MIRVMVSLVFIAAVLAGCAPAPVADAGPATPGWTGRTVVLGSTSVGNPEATFDQQKWQMGRQR